VDRRRRLFGLTATMMVSLFVAACGSSNSSSSSSSGGSASNAAASSSSGGSSLAAFNEKVQSDVTAASAAQTQTPPTTGSKAVPGKNIVIIPVSMAFEGTANPARAALAAAKAIGWQARIIDPQGQPPKMAAAVQQAIATHASGIVTEAIDPANITAALQAARSAHIPLVSYAVYNKPALYDASVPAGSGGKTFGYNQGYRLAEALYEGAHQNLKLIVMTATEFGVIRDRQAGTEQFVKDCQAAGGKCTILSTQNILAETAATAAPPLAVNTMRQNPQATAWWDNADASLQLQEPALKQAGLTGQSIAGSFDGNPANIAAISQGDWLHYDWGIPLTWVGYGQIDELNRIFAGQQPVDENIVPKLFTPQNAPKSGVWNGDSNPVPTYMKVWGR
jgi:ribose transport system substrate-binding protein